MKLDDERLRKGYVNFGYLYFMRLFVTKRPVATIFGDLNLHLLPCKIQQLQLAVVLQFHLKISN